MTMDCGRHGFFAKPLAWWQLRRAAFGQPVDAGERSAKR
jgi:hypothetical protein